MENTTVIGTFHLLKDRTFCDRGYACAAWYENIYVKAGDYPLYIHNYTERERDGGIRVGCWKGVEMGYVALNGVTTDADFGARFCGVPVGGDNSDRYIGRESCYHWSSYLYSIADDVLHNNGEYREWGEDEPYARIELNPEYEAREIHFISNYDGKELTTHGIYKREV